ncbi:MAG: beta-ketoacyl synthase N-terminal-like domain-containing protein [Planctomycetota bacterium]
MTGLGVITPLGSTVEEVLGRMARGDCAAAAPTGFDPRPFPCRQSAEIADFDAQACIPEAKTLRLMSRDAVLAVAAARAAMADAGVRSGETYAAEDIALYGSTGLAGMQLAEVAGLVRQSVGPDGRFDPGRFGTVGLKRVRPVLSFKILSNMPICFVSIFQHVRGPNAVYNPWEGQGAQAIAAGVRAVAGGEVPCALVGGCDAKAHELAFISLTQQGVFESWRRDGAGCVPGEGAAFLVLEEESRAAARGANIRARLAGHCIRTAAGAGEREKTYRKLLSSLPVDGVRKVVSAADGDERLSDAERRALAEVGIDHTDPLEPKRHAGNLFAAAAALQVGLAAATAGKVLANCFGYGAEQAAFVLEPA